MRINRALKVILLFCVISVFNNSCSYDNPKEKRFLRKNPNVTRDKTVVSKLIAINGIQYRQTDKNGRLSSLLEIRTSQTIVPEENYYHDLEILDINRDGFKDLRVFIMSNTSNECANYLFNPKDSTFFLLRNADLDITKLENTNWYYTYNSMGCSDMLWESFLGKIEDKEFVKYGRIEGNGCSENDVDSIRIFKLKNKPQLFKTLPYRKNIPENDSKFAFFKKYWINNAHLFKIP